MRIAILAWGSLLWDKDQSKPFDRWHGPWQFDGPSLRLEFSRVSKSRLRALTLVLDSINGSRCRVAWCLSKRDEPEDAICDLCCREGTTRSNAGWVFLQQSRSQY